MEIGKYNTCNGSDTENVSNRVSAKDENLRKNGKNDQKSKFWKEIEKRVISHKNWKTRNFKKRSEKTKFRVKNRKMVRYFVSSKNPPKMWLWIEIGKNVILNKNRKKQNFVKARIFGKNRWFFRIKPLKLFHIWVQKNFTFIRIRNFPVAQTHCVIVTTFPFVVAFNAICRRRGHNERHKLTTIRNKLNAPKTKKPPRNMPIVLYEWFLHSLGFSIRFNWWWIVYEIIMINLWGRSALYAVEG